jgi:hypothetical protein
MVFGYTRWHAGAPAIGGEHGLDFSGIGRPFRNVTGTLAASFRLTERLAAVKLFVQMQWLG